MVGPWTCAGRLVRNEMEKQRASKQDTNGLLREDMTFSVFG
jgi:hypothetical protein